MSRFTVIPLDVLTARPLKRDHAYDRKEAYRAGYIQALRDLDELAGMGFVRERERVSMLENHTSFRLKAWVCDKTQRNIWDAPRAWVGSTWWEIRKKVFARDGEVCDFCGATDDLQIDHIHEVKNGGLPQLVNLRVLCRVCNSGRNAK